MIKVDHFFKILKTEGISNFCGVPDSLLKHICAYISDNTTNNQHTITANEGSAVALAVGQYITTGKPSLVYMQNSGFGNAINPLLSLADEKVYGTPMLVMVGWRGEPGVKDEPQHIKQGEVMINLLDACGLPTIVIGPETKNIEEVLKQSIQQTQNESHPVVLLIKKDTFDSYDLRNITPEISQSRREEAIERIIQVCGNDDIFISTTGMASRELFEIRVKNQQSHNRDFLTVGSMGHASMIAMGIAQNTNKNVFCIDGDGASIMHLGNLTSIGQSKCSNIAHILLNNAAHDSVGGQPTCANNIDLTKIASSCGYSSAQTTSDLDEIKILMKKIKSDPGPHFLEVKIKKGSRPDLGRPTSSPAENKTALMKVFS